MDQVFPSPVSLYGWPLAGAPGFPRWQGVAPTSLIMTPDGERAIDRIISGDLMVRMYRPGIGRVLRSTECTVDLGRHPEAAAVLILADALADGMPARTVELAPDSLVDFRDVLVPALALVNDMSVVRLGAVGRARYLHLEAPEHEIMVVDGMRVATFLASRKSCRPIADTMAVSRARASVNARVKDLAERGWMTTHEAVRLGCFAGTAGDVAQDGKRGSRP